MSKSDILSDFCLFLARENVGSFYICSTTHFYVWFHFVDVYFFLLKAEKDEFSSCLIFSHHLLGYFLQLQFPNIRINKFLRCLNLQSKMHIVTILISIRKCKATKPKKKYIADILQTQIFFVLNQKKVIVIMNCILIG